MRERLVFKSGHKCAFKAVFCRFGTGRDWQRPTALLLHLRDARTGKLLADHIWCRWTADARDDLRVGDRISLTATPHMYWTTGAYTDTDDVVCYGECRDIDLREPARVRVYGNVLDADEDWFGDWEQRALDEFLADEQAAGLTRKPLMCRTGAVDNHGSPTMRFVMGGV